MLAPSLQHQRLRPLADPRPEVRCQQWRRPAPLLHASSHVLRNEEARVGAKERSPGLLRNPDPGQWEDWVAGTNPDFIEIIKRSEARYKAEGGISMDEIRRKYGIERKPVRKAG